VSGGNKASVNEKDMKMTVSPKKENTHSMGGDRITW